MVFKVAPAAWTPVPVSGTDCGELATESVKVNEAEREPAAEGENVRFTAQLDAAVRVDPQVVLRAKSVAFAPLSETLKMLSGPVPVLAKVTPMGALTLPTF